MMVINVYSPKGGVGTTTIASLLAHDYSKHHYIGLVSNDTNANAAVLGFGNLEVPYKMSHGLTLSNQPIPDCDFLFVDSRAHMLAADMNILVVQNSYACLRKAIDCKRDLLVANIVDGSALSLRDVNQVMGSDHTQDMEWCAATARSLDAGLPASVLARDDWKRLVERVDSIIKQDAPF